MTPETFQAICVTIGLVCVGVTICLACLRLARGPRMVDRVVALDMVTAAVITVCGLYAIRTGAEAFLDIAVALALVSFLSVVALARYAERQVRRGDCDD
ncbi:monovalent cation/H+ antiporter complex subunit F [Falsirhodobacter halotolerans]|uniref:monovalent cation/H+ antiporter complex subunit F n=1 Tax=Falsirhodobacter halotolerans TaxID=1146892 RepID=UPI001FD12EC8|nr:monovalent cation/H+ antiporter complex subunit F [Falsirhodobacter halotolerans]MCJ8140350.1 monovalent cation/H+ antiporter complex subunit F [Falsirhodobacter halotolerans]